MYVGNKAESNKLSPDDLTMAEETDANRSQQAEKVIEFLLRSNLLDNVDSPDKKKELLSKLTPENMEDILERLNGIIIDMPIHQRSIYEHVAVVVDPETHKPIYIPPHPSIQKKIVRELIIPNIHKLPPDEVAEVVASEINAIHMFPNGNGRLARIVYLLLKPDFIIDKSDECLATMSHYLTKREGALNFDPSIIENDIRETIFDRTSGNDLWSDRTYEVINLKEITDSIGEDYENETSIHSKILTRLSYLYSVTPFDVLVGLRKYLKLTKGGSVADFLVKDVEKDTFAIDAKKVADSIKNQQGYNNLFETLEAAKILRARVLIDMYIHPNQFPSSIPGVSLKEHYQREVAKRAGVQLET